MIHLTDPVLRPVKPDITPLLDVVFILLIFFVVSSVFTVQGIKMDLPEASTATAISGPTHRIRIMKDNTLRFDDQVMDMRELSFKLQNIKTTPNGHASERIILECSPLARVAVFIKTADMVKAAGFEDLIIATTRP
ncbi:biopolymer transporter ExbD [uncultured Desulfobacter sp.]|uniref:ExbD/TolR family protein n=1 Tax=uncultured Desulfobacter sp. TaxID=240139 RepID=UPI002AAB311C|nr:biopolymer transporter ExbD [uncultured Desulfobacter sp.]